MLYDNQIATFQREISDLRARFAEYEREVVKANETARSSLDLDEIAQAMARGAASVPARRNIERKIADVEKEIGELRVKREAFLYELQVAAPKRLETAKTELETLRRRRAEGQDSLARLKNQAQAVTAELAKLPKAALAGFGIGQDDAIAARRCMLSSRAEDLQLQLGRVEGELQIGTRLVFECEASIEKMTSYLDGLKAQATAG